MKYMQRAVVFGSGCLVFLFPYLVVLSYFFLFLETYTYLGFLRRIILLNSIWFAWITFGVGFVVGMIPEKKLPQYTKLLHVLDQMYIVNRLFFPVTLFLYIIFFTIELRYYPNYIFYHYHFNPLLFKNILIFNVGISLIHLLSMNKHRIYRVFAQIGVAETFAFSAVVLVFATNIAPTVLGVMNYVIADWRYVFTHLNSSYEERVMRTSSDYPYFAFLRDHTPPDAVIAAPPQRAPWLTSGNEGYIRYYLYPRRIVKNPDRFYVDPSANYVMIDNGEWAVPDPAEYGWPKATVSATKIWYFDRATKTASEGSETVFDPSNPAQRNQWGVIQVKKD